MKAPWYFSYYFRGMSVALDVWWCMSVACHVVCACLIILEVWCAHSALKDQERASLCEPQLGC